MSRLSTAAETKQLVYDCLRNGADKVVSDYYHSLSVEEKKIIFIAAIKDVLSTYSIRDLDAYYKKILLGGIEK